MPVIALLSGNVLSEDCEGPCAAIELYGRSRSKGPYVLQFSFRSDDGSSVQYDLYSDQWADLQCSSYEFRDVRLTLVANYATYTLRVSLVDSAMSTLVRRSYSRRQFSNYSTVEFRIAEWREFFTEVLEDFELTLDDRFELVVRGRYLAHPECETQSNVFHGYPDGITVPQWLDYNIGTLGDNVTWHILIRRQD